MDRTEAVHKMPLNSTELKIQILILEGDDELHPEYKYELNIDGFTAWSSAHV